MLAFVNGMGGTPLIELYVVFNELAKILKGKGITIARNLVGNYITSLEMAGCSITLLQAGRRADQTMGRAGAYAGLALGSVRFQTVTSSSNELEMRNLNPALDNS